MGNFNKVLVIDTETTGLKAGEDEILQLSIVDEDKNIVFNEYFKPTKHDSWPEASKINHIYPDMLSSCKSILDRANDIEKIFANAKLIIGYNVDFDLDFLRASGIKISKNKKTADVMRMHQDSTLNHRRVSLVKCCEAHGYNWSNDIGPHNALGDCYATLFCYNALLEKNKSKAAIRF